jgi:predicted CxxxxCH...CXXCH cytochrome family protein
MPALSKMWRTVLHAVTLGWVLNAGCSALDPSPASTTPPAPNSFTEVYRTIIASTCTNNYCHYNGVGIRYGALDMSAPVYAYWSLVGQPCMGPSCSEMGTRVIPGQPDQSILYLKVSQTQPPCGSQMPADPVALTATGTSVFSGTALPDDQQQLIHDWILDGAQNN